MFFFVTRPPLPVPATVPGSTPCSAAIRATTGETKVCPSSCPFACGSGAGAAQPIFKVNLIPYNPTGSEFEGSSRESIAAFRAALESRGVPVTVRLTRGRDIAAACGQLAATAA